jgi:hypothetical protein
VRTVTAQIVVGLLLLTGCSAIPVTDGFHGQLPSPGTSTIVWGDDLAAIGTATTWLHKRGLSVIERSNLQLGLDAESIQLDHTLKDEAAVLRAAKKMGVAEVVFVDRAGDLRAPMVTVRGVNVETARVQWSGSARYTSFEARPPKDKLVNLTCEALATAWGFRPAGKKLFISSQKMCGLDNVTASAPRKGD